MFPFLVVKLHFDWRDAMDPLTIAAASGMRARLEALDLLANNIANSSTPGFKADREAYTSYLGEESLGAEMDGVGYSQISSPLIEAHRTDFSQGALTPTGSASDLALSGDGFFLLDSANGPLLTRSGKLHVSRDGRLLSAEGHEFATVAPQRIRADPELPVEVDSDGTVRQQGSPLGRLKVVKYAIQSQPPKREGVYFALDTGQARTLVPSEAEVQQGMVENSNYSVPEAAVRLVAVLRQFESLQKALQLGGEMGRKAVEEVARVNP